jgi:N-acetylneuraminic acid mutarotase
MRQQLRKIYLLISPALLFASCESTSVDLANGDWIKLSDLDGKARHAAAGFAIDGTGYLGLGADGDNTKLNDFWKYDPVKNTWSQIADYPGLARTATVSFSANGNGYVSTGLDIDENRLNELYAYNPESNQWTKKADFEGTARRNATSFVIDNEAYVGTGFDGSYLKDFYKYIPSADRWEKISSIGGGKRIGAASFVINNKGYVGTGNNNGSNLSDFWVYDPQADIWTEALSMSETTVPRSYGVGFALKNKGYFTGGAGTNSVWEYSVSSTGDEAWAERASFEGTSRNYAVCWVINNEAYVATGSNGSYRMEDIWKFIPDVVQEN